MPTPILLANAHPNTLANAHPNTLANAHPNLLANAHPNTLSKCPTQYSTTPLTYLAERCEFAGLESACPCCGDVAELVPTA